MMSRSWMQIAARALLLAPLMTAPAPAGVLQSPSGALSVHYRIGDLAGARGSLLYRITRGDRTVLIDSRIALDLEDGPLAEGLEIAGESRSEADATWKPVCGERSVVRDRFRQVEIELRESRPPGRRFTVTFRAYDEGVAFRYALPAAERGTKTVIRAERSEFRFGGDHPAWAVYSAQGIYERSELRRIRSGCERPLVVELAGDLYAAIGEAGLIDFARMKLAPLADGTPGVASLLHGAVALEGPVVSPWRVIQVAGSPGGLLEQNDIYLNLSEPCAIEDTSWIRPGKVIREVTLTTEGGKACADFAAAHGLQFVELDAGWYGPEDSDDSDATTVTVDPKRSPGPLDLPEVIRYAGDRGIGIILYVNRRALERQLDEILPLYRRWGVQGVKYGFVQVGSQRWTSWLHHAVRKAAENRLMVDIHDEYRPTGYSRTYPNLMTQEGIAGDETRPANRQSLAIIFTRMLAGAGDNTICYYDPRVTQNATHAYQLAKAVAIYSPWQFLFWYDRPADSPRRKGGAGGSQNIIGDEPELEFFAHLPTVWDETRVLHGRIGEHAVIARRSGERWFVGAMNGDEPRAFEVPLAFLEAGRRYVLHAYRDDPSVATRTRVRISRAIVGAASRVKIDLPPRGGEALRIVPAQEGDA